VTIGQAPPVPVTVSSISASPDGTSIAVLGGDGVQVLQAHGAPAKLDESVSSVGSWSADGDTLAYFRITGDDASVWLTALDGTPLLVAETVGFVAPRLSADGSFVVYNQAVDAGQGFAEPRARARPLS
jgi:hypothetical protein